MTKYNSMETCLKTPTLLGPVPNSTYYTNRHRQFHHKLKKHFFASDLNEFKIFFI